MFFETVGGWLFICFLFLNTIFTKDIDYISEKKNYLILKQNVKIKELQ